MTSAQRKLIETTRSATRACLERIQRTATLASGAVESAEPENAAEYLLDLIGEFKEREPGLRRALRAARAAERGGPCAPPNP